MADFEDSSHQPLKSDPVDDYLLETAGLWMVVLFVGSVASVLAALWWVFG